MLVKLEYGIGSLTGAATEDGGGTEELLLLALVPLLLALVPLLLLLCLLFALVDKPSLFNGINVVGRAGGILVLLLIKVVVRVVVTNATVVSLVLLMGNSKVLFVLSGVAGVTVMVAMLVMGFLVLIRGLFFNG